MNGKFEDKLAQLAFGELTPVEAAKIEQEVKTDPEALRALSLYKDMRDGLRSLSDVPEDQFSKERLRDAILTQGLKPVPTRPITNRSWLWMPTAACVLGFALMVGVNFSRRQHVHPQLVMNTDMPGVGLPKIQPIEVASASNSGSIYGPFAPPKLTKSTEPDSEVPRKDPNEADARILTSITNGSDDAYDPDLGNLPPSGAASSVGSTTVANVTPPSVSAGTNSGPIVLIEQDTDEQTGALKATEVGSSSNVLVGG